MTRSISRWTVRSGSLPPVVGAVQRWIRSRCYIVGGFVQMVEGRERLGWYCKESTLYERPARRQGLRGRSGFIVASRSVPHARLRIERD
jgi:hypothetical protein